MEFPQQWKMAIHNAVTEKFCGRPYAYQILIVTIYFPSTLLLKSSFLSVSINRHYYDEKTDLLFGVALLIGCHEIKFASPIADFCQNRVGTAVIIWTPSRLCGLRSF